MQKTFRKFNGKTYMLDEFSYFGPSKSDAEKRRAMIKKSVLGVRCIKKSKWQIRDISRISWGYK